LDKTLAHGGDLIQSMIGENGNRFSGKIVGEQ
jgi:hypothetical protein